MKETLIFRAKEDELQALREQNALYTDMLAGRGTCKACGHWYKKHCSTGPCAAEETDRDFYCKNFEPRELQSREEKELERLEQEITA